MGSFQKHRFCVGQLFSELPVCLSQIPSGGVTGPRSYTGFCGGAWVLNSGPHAARQALFTVPQPRLSLLKCILIAKATSKGLLSPQCGQREGGVGEGIWEKWMATWDLKSATPQVNKAAGNGD